METKRLIFEKFEQVDFKDYFRLLGDKMVMKMITGKVFTEAEAKEKFKTVLQINERSGKTGYFKLVEKHNLRFIGLSKIILEDKTKLK